MAWACVALIVYASLHPFAGWVWPASGWGALWLPWPHYIGGFDVMANVLGYLPLGFFVAAAGFARARPLWAVLGATLGPAALLSYAMEVLQQALPVRVPSLLDWTLNVLGAACGAVLAGLAVRFGLGQAWHRWRQRWRVADDGMALTLLLLWPLALLFPVSVPFGLGQVMLRLREWMADGLEGTDFEGWVGVVDGALVPPLPPGPELLATALGLVAPCLVAYTVVRKPLYRAVLALGVGAVGAAATSLSTALNFSPEHAMTWISRSTLPGMQVAALLALAMLWLRPRVVAALGLVLVTAGLFLANMAPVDPYLSSSLQGWEQGRFIRFHGVAQWIGWAWPFAALAQLLRTVFREPAASAAGGG